MGSPKCKHGECGTCGVTVHPWCFQPAPDHIADADKKVQPARCPHCGYKPGVIPSDFDAYAQANCEHRESHGKPAPAPRTPEGSNTNGSCGVLGGNPRTPAPLPSFAFDSHTHALEFIAASLTDLGGEQEALDTVCAHISDLTRRLAEAEAENGRFAGMLEDSVSGWRKLYTEERAERVRIEGVLLNDVQAERQESDEHIKGLNAVIKTQDKAIRDLKSRVVELAADWQVQFAKAEAAEARVRELEFYRADALKEMRQQLELLSAYHVEGVTARIGSVLARVRELEAFKARVMEWARWRCGACEHEGSEDDTCYNCQSDDEQSNWMPPQAWEVGE